MVAAYSSDCSILLVLCVLVKKVVLVAVVGLHDAWLCLVVLVFACLYIGPAYMVFAGYMCTGCKGWTTRLCMVVLMNGCTSCTGTGCSCLCIGHAHCGCTCTDCNSCAGCNGWTTRSWLYIILVHGLCIGHAYYNGRYGACRLYIHWFQRYWLQWLHWLECMQDYGCTQYCMVVLVLAWLCIVYWSCLLKWWCLLVHVLVVMVAVVAHGCVLIILVGFQACV